MTGMEIKRARGKCIANALVCQLCWTFLLQPGTQAPNCLIMYFDRPPTTTAVYIFLEHPDAAVSGEYRTPINIYVWWDLNEIWQIVDCWPWQNPTVWSTATTLSTGEDAVNRLTTLHQWYARPGDRQVIYHSARFHFSSPSSCQLSCQLVIVSSSMNSNNRSHQFNNINKLFVKNQRNTHVKTVVFREPCACSWKKIY